MKWTVKLSEEELDIILGWALATSNEWGALNGEEKVLQDRLQKLLDQAAAASGEVAG